MPLPSTHHSSPDDAKLLAEVERASAPGLGTLRFREDLEQRYETDTLAQRRHFITAVGIAGALVYNLFLISDWLVLNDMFFYVAAGRLFLITPMFIALLLIGQRLQSRPALETIAAFGTVACSLMPLVVMIYSESPYRLQYQMGMLLIMVYATMIQQLPFRFAAAAMMSMLVIQLVTTYVAQYADFVIWQSNAVFYVSAVTLLLLGSWFLERGRRMSYLFALRGRLLQQQLMEVARIDALTQLFNRRYLGEVLELTWQRTAVKPVSVAIILLDVDHFKAYNDSYGHLQGDVCLREISTVIQGLAQERNAMAFRFGGEEFLILMGNAEVHQAQALAETLRCAVAAMAVPHPVLGENAHVTISLGVAAAIASQTSAEALVRAADNALYAAKRSGRDCLRCA